MLLGILGILGILGVFLVTGYAQAQTRHRVFLPLVIGSAAQQNELRTGQATYYAATGDGNCMFGPSPHDLMVAAISHEDYGRSNPNDGPAAVYCGAYAEVFGELGSVVVRIVDKCPDAICTSGHLDLSREAFARIAPIEKGIVPITWRIVSPDVARPVAYHFKSGSSQWWTAIQVRHHRNPIVSLEYRDQAGQWRAMVRQDYNYFIAERMGPGPYTLRVTDRYGNVVVDHGIPLSVNRETAGQGQFPAGP
ncbi:MAG: hypothetical protein EI684_21850 [Candidatus Viridilinea halotolerans]|uniref:RlpA-like protein double-psi beta-barrel domain-containing protein n=1 Tax=Candidatus Viridilinea halotolerans TaxID=2491704 RepID=A0A426TR52_9CHLR|nr:MAG: hypothetical protein EI684_21850 [Candidatus Viridilinea halotolerans]